MFNPKSLLALLCLLFTLHAPLLAQPQPFTFSFQLKQDATTSAGVYKKDGTLIRTLWNNVKYTKGAHAGVWDKLDDEGNAYGSNDVDVKVISANTTYTWEGGMIGNTSTDLHGAGKYHTFEPICAMVAVDKYMYCATNYNEGYPSQLKFEIGKPQVKHWATSKTIQGSQHVATDGVNLYWSLYDPFEVSKTLVFATRAGSDQEVYFNAGSKVTFRYGVTFNSGIGLVTTANSIISGLAVQKSGQYLFIARGGLNQLQVLNKTTGATIRTITLNGLNRVSIDRADNLWVTFGNKAVKYAIAADGTLKQTDVSVTVTGRIGSITVSPDNNTMALLDIDSQQVKAFNNHTGATLWVMGDEGGYSNNATVTNNKFYFKDLRHPDGYEVYIAYQQDGSFWVGDAGNFRHQHYAADRSYIESIMSLPAIYNTTVDPNVPTRVIANVLEFEIDYSKPLAPDNGSWKLKNNWGAQMTKEYDDFAKISNVVTLKNGRTYAFFRNNIDHFLMCELVPGKAIRYTGITFGQRHILAADGSKMVNPEGWGLNAQSRFLRFPLVGFDANNNPIWSNVPETMAVTPPLDKHDPWPTQRFQMPLTDTGNIIVFDADTKTGLGGKEYHLGAIKKGTNKWLWRTARGTTNDYFGDFPEDGAFDNGNDVNLYSGGIALTLGNSIFWGYHGEFWKASQVNKWNHIDARTGLMVGQFGVTGKDFPPGYEAPPQMAGNVFSGNIVTVNGVTYLYHNDESAHGGVHRWRLEGLETIELQEAAVPSKVSVQQAKGINLMEGLNTKGDMKDGNGWECGNQKRDFNWTVYVGGKSHNPFKSMDVFARYYQPSGPASERKVLRTLGKNDSLATWQLSGFVSWEGSTPNLDNNIQYVEVLDAKGRTITRLQMFRTFNGDPKPFKYLGNKKALKEGDNSLIVYGMKFQPFTMQYDSGRLTISYADFPAVALTQPMDAGADMANPSWFRLYFYCGNSFAENKVVSVRDLTFTGSAGKVEPAPEPVPAPTPDTTGKTIYRSRQTGRWSHAANWEVSTNHIDWKVATAVPDTSAGQVMITRGNSIAIDTLVIADEVIIEDGALLSIAPGGEVIVNNGEGDDITIRSGGKLLVRSTSAGTGIIGPSTGTIAGEVTVERFLPARTTPGFRMLAATVNSAGTIRDNWQEGVNNTSPNTNINPAPGYGVHITGSSTGANGFDAEYNGVSALYAYNDNINRFHPVNNTNRDKLSARQAYFLFLKGDRSIDQNNLNTHTNNTTIRATGSLLQGTQLYTNLQGNGMRNAIANPYAAPINWTSIYNDNKDHFENYYIVWDPNVGEKGGFVTVDESGTTSIKSTVANTHIQSGQSFFVVSRGGVAAPRLYIGEGHKSSAVNTRIPRFNGAAPAKLYLSLLYTDGNGAERLADGVLARYGEGFTAAIDGNDAIDLENIDEDVSLTRSSTLLSIESRPLPSIPDTLFMSVTNLKKRSYKWELDAADFNLPADVRAFLVDSYLGTEIPFEINGTTHIVFQVDGNPASANPKRFCVVFDRMRTLPVKFISFTATKQQQAVRLQWKTGGEQNMAHYLVQRSVNGVHFTTIATVQARGAQWNTYESQDAQVPAATVYYRIVGVENTGEQTITEVAVVKWTDSKARLSVYPNPAVGPTITIQLAGSTLTKAQLAITNVKGQAVATQVLNNTQLTAPFTYNVEALPAGIYWLTVYDGQEKHTVQFLKK